MYNCFAWGARYLSPNAVACLTKRPKGRCRFHNEITTIKEGRIFNVSPEDKMEFKKLNLADMETVIEIFGEAEHIFFDPSQPDHHTWGKGMADRHIGRGTTFWVGIISGEPIGLVGLLHDKQPNGKNREFAQITHIGVNKNIRKKGYGSSLLEFVESTARSQEVIILEVETNTNTAPFYEKNGYNINSKNRFGETVHLFKKLKET